MEEEKKQFIVGKTYYYLPWWSDSLNPFFFMVLSRTQNTIKIVEVKPKTRTQAPGGGCYDYNFNEDYEIVENPFFTKKGGSIKRINTFWKNEEAITVDVLCHGHLHSKDLHTKDHKYCIYGY